MSSPWKACDIRGIYPREVSADLLRRVGASVGSTLPTGARVLIAGDFRITTLEAKAALAQGLLGAGSHILDAGQIPTPIAYFAHQRCATDAVLIVTASHNPPDYNGLKLMLGELPPTPDDFDRLRGQVERGHFRKQQGKMESINPIPTYRTWVLERWKHLHASSPMAVVLDAGNGAWSELAPSLYAALGFRVHPLFCEVNGAFPNRAPDCARPSSLRALKKEVINLRAQMGIAWDGDGDRVAFVDECGSIVSPDEVSALMVRELATREPQSKVVYDIKLSDTVRQAVLECGGQPIMERSGHTFIKRTMIKQDGLLGCEASGHYFFRELRGGDDGVFAGLMMAEIISRRGVSLGKLRRSLVPLHVTPDLRIPASVLSYAEVARRLRSLFEDALEMTIDGIRLETKAGFILVRESVTEPVVTMRLEGRSKDTLQQLVSTCLKTFPEAAGEISNQIDQVRDA